MKAYLISIYISVQPCNYKSKINFVLATRWLRSNVIAHFKLINRVRFPSRYLFLMESALKLFFACLWQKILCFSRRDELGTGRSIKNLRDRPHPNLMRIKTFIFNSTFSLEIRHGSLYDLLYSWIYRNSMENEWINLVSGNRVVTRKINYIQY